jgi:hypothetical protein
MVEVTLSPDKQVRLGITLSLADFRRALAEGQLVIDLSESEALAVGESAPISAPEIAAVCRCYGPESLAANLLWEVAQAGESGIASNELKALLGLGSSQKLAGVFSGIGKTLERLLPGRKDRFMDRQWRAAQGEFLYRMPSAVRAGVIAAFG